LDRDDLCDTIRLMKKSPFFLIQLAVTALALIVFSRNAIGASWNGIEPFKSRRADVEHILGKVSNEGTDGTLHFAVAGGTAIVSFVDERFVTAKKLRRDLVGTVLEIVLQHEQSTETPDSMNLATNHDYDREDAPGISIFRNLKDGILYTFVNGKLRTTRFTFSAEQLGRARRGR
jgi:hypothetical protein